MSDEAQALIASPKLFAIYLDVPLHLPPLFPLALRLLPPLLVTLSNMPILALLLSVRISFSIHHFPLLCAGSPCVRSLCALCLSYQMMRARNVKSLGKTQQKAATVFKRTHTVKIVPPRSLLLPLLPFIPSIFSCNLFLGLDISFGI